MYPSISLARRYDPLSLARKRSGNEPPTLKQLQGIIWEDISKGLEALAMPTDETRVDEQWYWAAQFFWIDTTIPRQHRMV